jgi:hypothetical protein
METATYASLTWSRDYDDDGCWSLHILDGQGETSPMLARWESSPTPPALLARYDALAVLGFAVVEGGVEAWEWHEISDDDDSSVCHFMGLVEIRPLGVEELKTPLH